MAEKKAQKIKMQSDYLSDSESSEDEVHPHLRTSQEERVWYRYNKRICTSGTGSVVSYHRAVQPNSRKRTTETA